MKPKLYINYFIAAFISVILCVTSITQTACASDYLSFVILSEYNKTLKIHDEFKLTAITSTGRLAKFKSSDSKIASVDTYGFVTAKKGGTATITAKIKNAEASCKVKVLKTQIVLNENSLSLERGEVFPLQAVTSNSSPVTYKSNKKSVALVDDYGCITAIKPGEAIITASSDGSSATCKIQVKQPSLKLNKSKITLYRGGTFQLSASVSSNVWPVFSSNRKSVALVDYNGTITAVKNGYAIITAKVDGVTQICEVTVKSPVIKLEEDEIYLLPGESTSLKYSVSSGNIPLFTSSNSNVATVDSQGTVTAVKKGTANITISEDGAKIKCKIVVYK